MCSVLCKQRRDVEIGAKSPRYLKDDLKIINIEDDGILSYFGDYPVDDIATSSMRNYFSLLDDNRDSPLAASTKNKHGVILSKIFKVAAEYDAIKQIPVIPIFSVKDNPRVTFEENEYKEFLSAIRKCIKSGEIVRGHAISDEFYYFVCIIVHSYLRPTDREAFEPPPVCRRLQSKYGWSLWKKATELTDFRLKCVPARFG